MRLDRLLTATAFTATALVASACPQGPVAVIPNTPPLVSIEDPIVPPSGDPIVIEEAAGLTVTAVVSDAEDEESTLVIHWLAERTDELAEVEDLGDTQPDSTGFSDKLIGGLDPGFWTITAEVEDSHGATDNALLPIHVLSANLCPGVTITQPTEGGEFVDGEVITFTGTVNDDRGLDGISIEWFDNLDGLLDITAPSESGLLTFSRSNLTIGGHVVTLTATDDDGASCPQTVEFTVIPSDLPPYDFEIEIDPPEPTTDDDLRCLITQGSADPEGQPITYHYTWYADGVPTVVAGDTVSSDQTINLQEWTCEVVANDGTLDSNTAVDMVQIGNTVPTFESVLLSPDPGSETSILFCEGFDFDDADGDPEGWEATWYVDGLPVPGVTDVELDGTWFDRDQQVWCDLAPFDGYAVGEIITSNIIDIVNSAPSAPTVSVTPTPVALIDDDLSCLIDVVSVDPDGDPVLNPDSYEVTWLLDGVPDPSSDGLWILPSVKTSLGDEWTCQVRATDGLDWGDYGTAVVTVLPEVGDIVISEMQAAPSVVADVAGEWVEVYNNSGTTMSLQGFEIHDDDTDTHVIADDIVMPAGTYVVLGRNGDYLTNGSVLVAYEYTSFVLDENVDEVVLSFDSVEIDRVEYDLGLYPAGTPGHSLGWDPSIGNPDPIVNDDPANWCHSGNSIGLTGTTDWGTPGGANDPCACFTSDGDGDGWGDDSSCGSPDCDDSDPAFSPGATDICEDGIDQNCDGFDAVCPCLDTDDDGDGYGDGLACSPVDCNDSDPSIFPSAVEACDSIDQDCDGVLDNGDSAVMCPPTTQVATTNCSGGDCFVSTCNSGYYDVNGFYSDGCEVQDDGISDACGGAHDLGDVNTGGSRSTPGGVLLPTSGDVDWYRVAFPRSGRPGGGTPTVVFSTRPTTDYYFDVFYSCSSVAVCGAGTSTGNTDYAFTDNQSTAGVNQWSTNASGWPDDLYIRVYRTGGGPTASSYSLSITR
ncbi:MAG: hypothetical protein GY898_00945 [Proteobacteria bacterium]|nr:hypothetical protein [Pseudomonadota bacterium]